MRRIALISVLLSCVSVAFAQNAVIQSYEESFTLQSQTSGVHKVSATVLVMNKNGLRQATPVIYTDSFRSLGSFKAETAGPDGKKVKSGKGEVQTVSISTGLASDSFISIFQPFGQYPMTVHYEYTVNYRNGVISFPPFSPLEDEDVSIVEASYKLFLPEGTEIVTYSNNVEELPARMEKHTLVREWRVKDFKPLTDESMMPPVREMIPLVMASPVDFSFSGTAGSQSDWQKAGQWLGCLQEGTDVLPQGEIDELKEITKDCKTDFEKLRVLYARLREKTRYVSIQLGIGGLKPMPAAQVAGTGFGDCKALSNYLQAMLSAVGVHSEYYIISTSHKDVFQGYPSVGQMNHAMLAVPMKEFGDTVFVECTNPRYPLGYRHSDAAGHEIVLITGDGGKKVRIGSYPDSLSRQDSVTEIDLRPDGSAAFKVERRFYLDLVESYIGFSDRRPEEKEKQLTRGLKVHPEGFRIGSVRDNFNDYPSWGREYCPKIDIDYSFSAPRFAQREGIRLFVPLNPSQKGLSFQKGERKNDIYVDDAYTVTDTVIVKIPQGYEPENIPGPVSMSCEWADFESGAQLQDGAILVVQRFSYKPWRADKSRYPELRKFIRTLNEHYDDMLVLKEKEPER